MKLCIAIFVCFCAFAIADPYWDRAAAIVQQMTLIEIVGMVHGNQSQAQGAEAGYVGFSEGVSRLNVPGVTMNDGPQGFRGPPGKSTQWPSGMTVAQTFDRSAMRAFGIAMGKEFAGKGCDVQFGPGVNIARLPWGGRNFEYLSGEDPFLGHEMAYEVVTGIQSQGVIANAKHFFNNNQETNRHYVSENVDERTQMEIYMPPYEGAVKAGVLSMMCGNNRVNQNYSCANSDVNQKLLRGVVGFDGWMLSDYRATQSTVGAALYGLDQQMPGCSHPNVSNPLFCDSDPVRPNYFGQPLIDAVNDGSVPLSVVQDKATRIIRAMMISGAFNRSRTPDKTADANVTSTEHKDLARKLSLQSLVLLKNEGDFLPLSASSDLKIAVLGVAGHQAPITGGGGSGAVTPVAQSSVFEGIRDIASSAANVTYNNGSDVQTAVQLAQQSDVTVVVIATSSHEGADRATLDLDQADLATAVAGQARNVVVVAVSPGTFVARPWLDNATAVVYTGMTGQEQGAAVAQLLFNGAESQQLGCPCGRIPFTIPTTMNQVNFSKLQYPGIGNQSNYTEELLVGYRYFTTAEVEPEFPFGYGLTYNAVEYVALAFGGAGHGAYTATVTLRNPSNSAVRAVPQLYTTYPDTAGEPVLQLKAFTSIVIGPKATTQVALELNNRSFSVWDVSSTSWKVVDGEHRIQIGPNVNHLLLNTTVMIEDGALSFN